MLLLSAALACLTALPLEGDAALRTFPIAATDVQIRLSLPDYKTDDARQKLLRETTGEHLLAAGTLGSTDLRITLIGGPDEAMDGDAARKGILGQRLLGMGLSKVAGYESAQTIRALNPPYREFDRHGFLLGCGALAHVQVIALEQADPEKFGDAGFERMLASARFAVVRRTGWDDLPARYIELSTAAASKKDAVAWLREQAAAPGAGWIEKLVAVEHAHAQHSTEPFTIELGNAVRTELLAKEKRTREEDAGLLLAEDGLGIALLRAGDVDGAEPHLQTALTLAPLYGDRTVAGVLVSHAFARAARKDAPGVVALLADAFAKDPAQKYRMTRETLLDPVRADPKVDEILKIVLKAPSTRSLGGH